MLSTLGKSFRRQHIEIFFLIFHRKQVLAFHIETICMKCHSLFSGKNEKTYHPILLSAENAHRIQRFMCLQKMTNSADLEQTLPVWLCMVVQIFWVNTVISFSLENNETNGLYHQFLYLCDKERLLYGNFHIKPHINPEEAN